MQTTHPLLLASSSNDPNLSQHEEFLFLEAVIYYRHDPIKLTERFVSIMKDKYSQSQSSDSIFSSSYDRELFKQEYFLWLLMLLLINHRLHRSKPPHVPPRINVSDVHIVDYAFANDAHLQEYWIVQHWLEQMYEPEVSTIIQGDQLDLNGMRLIPSKMPMMDANKNFQKSNDSIKDHRDDLEYCQSSADVDLAYHVFELLRAGRPEAALDFLSNSNQPARCSTLVMLAQDACYFLDQTLVLTPNIPLKKALAVPPMDQCPRFHFKDPAHSRFHPCGLIDRHLVRTTNYLVSEQLASIPRQPSFNGRVSGHYETALYALAGGNLIRLLPVCHEWEDILWAHIRLSIDQHLHQILSQSHPLCWQNNSPTPVQNPITSPSISDLVKNVLNRPSNWPKWPSTTTKNGWYPSNTTTPLLSPWSDLFSRLQTTKVSLSPFRRIATAMILNQSQEMLKLLCELTSLSDDINDQQSIQQPTQNPSNYFLRFSAHMVLLLATLDPEIDPSNPSNIKQLASTLLTHYIQHLIAQNQKPLVAHYCSYLPSIPLQNQLYLGFLNQIKLSEERERALRWGEEAGLDIAKITTTLVDHLIKIDPKQVNLSIGSRKEDESTLGMVMGIPGTEVSDKDWERIEALEWLALTYSVPYRLSHAMTLARSFIRSQKIQSCMALFQWLSQHGLTPNEEIERDDQQVDNDSIIITSEYASWKSFLDAQSAYTDWVIHHSSKSNIKSNLFNLSTNQDQEGDGKETWKKDDIDLTSRAVKALGWILHYQPHGWLVDPVSSSEKRKLELIALKQQCIPHIVLLLHHILHETKQYVACLKLADIIAKEGRSLYQYWRKEELHQLLLLLRSDALILLKQGGNDPLGYE